MNSYQVGTQEKSRSDMAEMRDLLHQLLSNQGELRQVIDLQNSGEHAGELVMLEGQRVRTSTFGNLICHYFTYLPGAPNDERNNGIRLSVGRKRPVRITTSNDCGYSTLPRIPTGAASIA